ncbi:hypothetical protein BD560DRAFT_417646 [Blakeslea trispora]|nr:hypothetical protein BD560DRAFT_417646 [Blakeslea trispora]
MSDFDITNVRAKNSFLANLKKRKAFGLDNSDSESDTEQEKKKIAKRPPSIKKEDKEATEEEGEEQGFVESNVNPFLEDIGALELIKAISHAPSVPKPAPVTNIALSDDELDLDLDPELAAALNKVEQTAVPQKVTIKLQYQHNFTSISEKSQQLLTKLMKPIKVMIMDNDQFHRVMDVFCKHKKLNKSEFVLVYHDEPVFLSATPSGIGLSPIGTNSMSIYPKHCYDSIRQQKQQEKEERLKRLKELELEEEEEEEVVKEEQKEEEHRIILKLRHRDKQEVSFRIKPTSTLASLVEPYKIQTKICAFTTIEFEFEGEALDMNQKIEDTELEDEDIVEVKIRR